MKKVCIGIVAVVLTGCATLQTRDTAVTLEIRPASRSADPGLTRMTLPGDEAPVYVSDDILLSNADVESARVLSAPSGPQVEIVFTEAGKKRFASATENNVMKPLAFLIDGHLVSAPIVREKIPGGKALIVGQFSEEEAKRIADGIARH